MADTSELSPRPDREHSERAAAPPRKRPYTPPTLVAYGTLARLTGNGRGSGTDGGGTMAMMCL